MGSCEFKESTSPEAGLMLKSAGHCHNTSDLCPVNTVEGSERHSGLVCFTKENAQESTEFSDSLNIVISQFSSL